MFTTEQAEALIGELSDMRGKLREWEDMATSHAEDDGVISRIQIARYELLAIVRKLNNSAAARKEWESSVEKAASEERAFQRELDVERGRQP